MTNNNNKDTIKFFRNWSNKNKRFYISGKGFNPETKQNDKTFYLNLSSEPIEGLYLNMDLFKNGLEVDKYKLALKADTDNVLVLKEKYQQEYAITKADIDKAKKERERAKKIDSSFETMLADVVRELLDNNNLTITEGGVCSALLISHPEGGELEPIEEDKGTLPF